LENQFGGGDAINVTDPDPDSNEVIDSSEEDDDDDDGSEGIPAGPVTGSSSDNSDSESSSEEKGTAAFLAPTVMTLISAASIGLVLLA